MNFQKLKKTRSLQLIFQEQKRYANNFKIQNKVRVILVLLSSKRWLSRKSCVKKFVSIYMSFFKVGKRNFIVHIYIEYHWVIGQ